MTDKRDPVDLITNSLIDRVQLLMNRNILFHDALNGYKLTADQAIAILTLAVHVSRDEEASARLKELGEQMDRAATALDRVATAALSADDCQ
jgi:hypothetical protein